MSHPTIRCKSKKIDLFYRPLNSNSEFHSLADGMSGFPTWGFTVAHSVSMEESWPQLCLIAFAHKRVATSRL